MAKIHPTPIGANLTENQIDEVCKTVFNRYVFDYGMTGQYNDETNKGIRKLMQRRTKEILDAMEILGFKVIATKGREDVGREFLTKSTIKSTSSRG